MPFDLFQRWQGRAAVFAWCACVALGMHATLRYSFSASPMAAAPDVWPADSSAPLDGERPTLLVFLHPYCPCSAATVTEIGRIVRSHPGGFDLQIRFCDVDGGDVSDTPLWRAAAGIPGARLQISTGDEVRRFGVRTSGESLAYSPDGRLRFQGGVTISRGHEGESAGSRALVALLESGGLPCERMPVFGCRLFNP
jgi:hypothetical protein